MAKLRLLTLESELLQTNSSVRSARSTDTSKLGRPRAPVANVPAQEIAKGEPRAKGR